MTTPIDPKTFHAEALRELKAVMEKYQIEIYCCIDTHDITTDIEITTGPRQKYTGATFLEGNQGLSSGDL